MNVALDIRMIRHSGIGNYLQGLLNAFALILNTLRQPFFFTLIGDKKSSATISIPENSLWVNFPRQIYSLPEQLFYPLKKLKECNLLHYPHYNAPLGWHKKLIVNFHDLNHLVFPQFLPTPLHKFYARYFYKRTSASADKIIVPTEFIRQQVIERLGVEDARLEVIPYAASEDFSPPSEKNSAGDEQTVKKYALPQTYLLTIGINKPHKNYLFLLRGLLRFWQTEKKDFPPLVMVGFELDKKAKYLRRFISGYHLEEKIKILGYLPQRDLPSIYRCALALIFPSLYEGFGLPALEAMKCEIPVVAADIPPLREICKDAALFFNPENLESLLAALEQITQESALREDLIQRGLRRQQAFTWKQIAEKTLALYQSVINTNI